MTERAATRFTFPLGMQLGDAPAQVAAAWFIPGEEPVRWVAEMAAWEVSLAEARVYAVPRGAGDPLPCGVLVVLGAGMPKVRAAIAYARLGRGLYFPADAKLEPVISAEEADRGLRWAVNVLHPSAGLVGFAAEDGMRVDALLAAPPRREADWNAAVVGNPARPRLVSVLAEAMPTMAEIMRMAQDDIGSEADEDLPLAPDEHPLGDAAGQIGRSMLRPFLAHLASLLSMAGNSAKGNPLGKRMMEKLKALDESLERHRQRELNRLLELMKTNPDEGLKYALPLRDMPTRGVAPPSSVLGQRNVEFNYSSLSGGNRKGDAWNVQDDLRRQLRANYLESANRELRLARFRRAAYIFAHLLGDFSAAADALRRGRHFREAAAIYQQQLKNPRAAADCLADGGLLLEAIPMYQELGLHQTAGELFEKLGQVEEANACYREAVRQHAEAHNFISAAKLLEEKLQAPDEAMECLASTWPDEESAGKCLQHWFSLCGRLARNDQALRRVESLAAMPPIGVRYQTLVDSFALAATAYPDVTVAETIRDTTRVLIGKRLLLAKATEHKALVNALTSLVPGDRLLSRDGNRFLTRLSQRPQTPPTPSKGKSPAVRRSFHLPHGFRWHAAVAIPGGFLSLGSMASQYAMVRSAWDGGYSCSYVQAAGGRDSHILLPPDDRGQAAMAAVSTEGAVAIGPFKLLATDVFRNDLIARTPPCFAAGVYGACRSEAGLIWTIGVSDGEVVLTSHSPTDGAILSKRAANFSGYVHRPATGVIPMVFRNANAYLGWEKQLVCVPPDVERATGTELAAPIRSIVASPPFTAVRIIATFDDGWALMHDDRRPAIIGEGLVHPAATFLPDGTIVVVGENEGRVYRPSESALAFLGSFAAPSPAPLTVLPAGGTDFAIFSVEGEVDVYRFPV